MMEMLIYLTGQADKVETTFLIMAGAMAFVVGTIGLYLLIEHSDCGEPNAKVERWFCRCAWTLAALLGLYLFMPGQATLASMMVLPKLANNEDVRTIGDNSMQAMRKLTEQWLRQLNEQAAGTQGKKI